METFGEVIKAYRLNKGLTIKELAKDINVFPSFLSMMENNKNQGTAKEETIISLAIALGIDQNQLIYLAKKVPKDVINSYHENALAFFRQDLTLKKDDRLYR